ncbi:Alpha/Beta hydrolase protein [Collybia nuda]|uniref:Alpha/Beta hydrolase protein n=1 Tax=Collybia nuda TaxID=64659 RepID=A0A9P5XYZ6_9AGAR|nr:Alpha/Beta hydrolase protein [Collybia nuda]
MDVSQFRTTTTRRGYLYSYYYKAATLGKPTILFIHGFPSMHHNWSSQAPYFVQRGYGIIAPDMLGYGGTSAPDDVGEYKLRSMGEDIIDILNDLVVSKVIGVAHGIATLLLSRLLNTHASFFIGAAFLGLGYLPPQPTFDYKTEIAALNKLFGYDVFGYWDFFAAEDAVSLTEKNIDSFYSLLFPDDPLIWRTDLAPLGKAREWIEQNTQRPRAAFWTAEDQEAHQAALMQKGLRGGLNWYKARHGALNNADEKSIPQEAVTISIPTFFGGATKDYICAIDIGRTVMPRFCSNMMVKEFNTSHWIMKEAPDELNRALEDFFVTLC